ncbi:oleate hydratase [Eubacteriales bacterium OttesenSCG-928-A19]|nr:oleate hydratase [Eubacteriales bacterium OttesenSCG-928-A19]
MREKPFDKITVSSVCDLALDTSCNTVQGIKVRQSGEDREYAVRPEDYVFVTNGSMTTNSP